MGFNCFLTIGKFWRQRLGERRKGTFIKKLHNLGRMAVFCLIATPLLEHPAKNSPTILCQRNPRLYPEFLLPFKKYHPWETAGGHCMIIQAAWLLFPSLLNLRFLSQVCMHAAHATSHCCHFPHWGWSWGACHLAMWLPVSPHQKGLELPDRANKGKKLHVPPYPLS